MTSLANTASANILAAKDNNVPMASSVTHNADGQQQKEKDLEYHRQVLKSKMEAQESGNNYVSPSDEIMSPCTAKLNALRNKQVGKVKPKSLFAQASSKRLNGQEGLFGSKTTPTKE